MNAPCVHCGETDGRHRGRTSQCPNIIGGNRVGWLYTTYLAKPEVATECSICGHTMNTPESRTHACVDILKGQIKALKHTSSVERERAEEAWGEIRVLETELDTLRPDGSKARLGTPDQVERFSDALADVTCWLSGFLSGGGVYTPGSLDALRDLKDTLDRMQEGSK